MTTSKTMATTMATAPRERGDERSVGKTEKEKKNGETQNERRSGKMGAERPGRIAAMKNCREIRKRNTFRRKDDAIQKRHGPYVDGVVVSRHRKDCFLGVMVTEAEVDAQ